MFSKACEYGIRSLIFITQKSLKKERVNITEISEAIDSPNAFTAKILQKLVRGNILSSIKGPQGGFFIAQEDLGRVKLAEVVAILDGNNIYDGCGLGLRECNELKPCPLHDSFKSVRDDLKKMLMKTSLKDLAEQLEDGNTFLKL